MLSVAWLGLPYFLILSHKRNDFWGGKNMEHKICGFSPKFLSETFLILKNNSPIHYHKWTKRAACEIHAIFCPIWNKPGFSREIFVKKNIRISNFMKIRLVGGRPVPCGRMEGQAGRHAETNNRFSNFPNAPKETPNCGVAVTQRRTQTSLLWRNPLPQISEFVNEWVPQKLSYHPTTLLRVVYQTTLIWIQYQTHAQCDILGSPLSFVSGELKDVRKKWNAGLQTSCKYMKLLQNSMRLKGDTHQFPYWGNHKY